MITALHSCLFTHGACLKAAVLENMISTTSVKRVSPKGSCMQMAGSGRDLLVLSCQAFFDAEKWNSF